MLRRKNAGVFQGEIGSGTPWEDLGMVVERPESVKSNLEKLSPMIDAFRHMCSLPAWTEYLQPFLEKKARAVGDLLGMIKQGRHAEAAAEAAKIEAYVSILNFMNTMIKTAESVDRLAAAEAAAKDLAGGEPDDEDF